MRRLPFVVVTLIACLLGQVGYAAAVRASMAPPTALDLWTVGFMMVGLPQLFFLLLYLVPARRPWPLVVCLGSLLCCLVGSVPILEVLGICPVGSAFGGIIFIYLPCEFTIWLITLLTALGMALAGRGGTDPR